MKIRDIEINGVEEYGANWKSLTEDELDAIDARERIIEE
jgi:hypothetical protein